MKVVVTISLVFHPGGENCHNMWQIWHLGVCWFVYVCVCMGEESFSGETTKCTISVTPALSALQETDDSKLLLVSFSAPPSGQSLKIEDNNMHGAPLRWQNKRAWWSLMPADKSRLMRVLFCKAYGCIINNLSNCICNAYLSKHPLGFSRLIWWCNLAVAHHPQHKS